MKFIFLLFILASCASTMPKKAYLQSHPYQARPKITESYYKDGEQTFSETEVKTLLSKKVEVPAALKIAVVKLQHDSSTIDLFDYEKQKDHPLIITKSTVQYLEAISGKEKKIKSISLIPELIKPQQPSLKNIRDVGAIMQADLVLILQTRSQTDSKFHFFKENESKAEATVEAIVLDVRTGVIPFTSVATNMAQIKKDKDFSNEELYLRATLTAEDKSLKEIIENVGEYFN